ncbi:GNAT family N-acetyltransferase [Pseudovibrio sp. Alg231-02]|uniref:GNAT family N-acetyltransferase n=1 Tax=Pseudovibrio sp. Alg231-02 TaxID=1922223 RepID=UPI000D55ECBE|nr:GNAT family N-acetyltransferase [Pseudovibrio sp. Alg231-02]
MIEIVERNLRSFYEVPFNAYAACNPYVSPMKSDIHRFLSVDQNPLFESENDFTFFTAIKDGQPIGRITAHIHRASHALHDPDLAYFGFFDTVNDSDIADQLLFRAENWARGRGLKRICGNFNLTAMQQIGVQTQGFGNAPYTDMICGPSYLPDLLEENGYNRTFPMSTFELDLTAIEEAQMGSAEKQQALLEQGFQFVPITRRHLTERLEEARQILNESFADNPMFVPVTAEEFQFQAKEMKWIIDPRISCLLHYKGALAGVVIAIPDLNPFLKDTKSRFGWSTPWHFLMHRMKRKRAIVILQGVLPRFQSMGVNPMMLAHVMTQMKRAGYERAGGTWISESNHASLRQVEKAGGQPLHGLHLFQKELI